MRISSASAVPGPGRCHRLLCPLPHHGPDLGSALWCAEGGSDKSEEVVRRDTLGIILHPGERNVLERAKQRTEEETTHGSTLTIGN